MREMDTVSRPARHVSPEALVQLKGAPESYRFVWRAVHTDGRIIDQVDSQGREHPFSEVDRSAVVEFAWLPTAKGLEGKGIVLNPVEERLFATRRHKLGYGPGSGHTVAFCLGVERDGVRRYLEFDGERCEEREERI